ncbi:hypothetical protein ES703_00020 [subsurface metagenome]
MTPTRDVMPMSRTPSYDVVVTAPPRIETRAEIWVLDELPYPLPRILQVGVILEALIGGAWQLLGGKIVNVTVHDPDGAWYSEWGQYTEADNWSWQEFMVLNRGTWTFKVSFAGDDEYEPCELTRAVPVVD